MSYHNLNKLNEQIVGNIRHIADYFNFELFKDKKFWVGCCPVHGGDNPTAFNMYHQGNIVGNWYCRTHDCHKKYGISAIGFIRGLLDCSYKEATEWADKFFGNEGLNYEIKQESHEDKITRLINKKRENYEFKYKIEREVLKSNLVFPCEYFLKRGFKKETLDFFEVGTCLNKDKPMFGRAVVPIYDTEGRYIVGCSGRSLYEKCKFCEGYHDPNRMCPSKDFVRFYSKWKHSVDYPASKTFYNYHNALEYIRKTHKVILVEGLGHVWKLHEAGHYNAIANFGLYFNDFKKSLLDNTGALDIIVLKDTGAGGDIFVKNINEYFEETHNIFIPEPLYDDDIADCDIETINKIMRNL